MEPGQSVQVTAVAHAGYQLGASMYLPPRFRISASRASSSLTFMASPLTERGSAKIAPHIHP